MDLMKLFGTVIAVFFHHGSCSASKINGQRICRRGTERPCYKVSYIQDSRRRLTFEDARQACRLDGGDLLSIETESEQRLIERFIQQLQAGDGDFWIGLRRSPLRHRTSGSTSAPACPSQYYWLDGSRAKFRNWHWDEPSCGREMCAVLYHQPSAPPDEEGHFLFHWNDDNCNAKNNYVCKYPEDRLPVFTVAWNTVQPVPSLRPHVPSTTDRDERIKIGQLEPSVSLSDNSLRLSYVLYGTIPVLLLLVLVTAFFCYKRVAKRRKAEADGYPGAATTEPWMSTTRSGPTPGPAAAVQGPYAFSDIAKLRQHNPGAPLASVTTAADFKRMTFCVSSSTDTSASTTTTAQCSGGDYENVSCPEESESGFVTNDIYETCRQQQSRRQQQQQQQDRSLHAGWVENEIYG